MMKLLFLLSMLMLSVGCKRGEETTDSSLIPEFSHEEAHFIKLATEALGDSANTIPSDIVPVVLRAGGLVQVEWPVPQLYSDRPNPPGPSYYFLVILEDSEPFKVINILASG